MKKPNRKRLTAAMVDKIKAPTAGRTLIGDTLKDANGLYVRETLQGNLLIRGDPWTCGYGAGGRYRLRGNTPQ